MQKILGIAATAVGVIILATVFFEIYKAQDFNWLHIFKIMVGITFIAQGLIISRRK